MSTQQQPIRWRTIVEVAVIAVVIYALLGAPGIQSTISVEQKVPVAKAKIESLIYPDKTLTCPKQQYSVHVFSSSPLMLYIDGFLSEAEADHLVAVSYGKWQVSTVFNEGIETTDESVRKSEKALIERDDVVQCIEQRALSFQGWPEDTFVERLWTQRYNVTGHYAYHYDWATASRTSRRISTFMVYVSADCTGGGTQFPRIDKPHDDRWCQFIECNTQDEGVTFMPRKGAAVFWMNFDAQGRGYKETLHAGLPVERGTKIGLNIWSWYQAGHSVK